MEHNNIYVYYRGAGEYILGKPILFVFPYSVTLTADDMCHFIASELRKKQEMIRLRVRNHCGWVCDRVLDGKVVQHESKRAIALASYSHNEVYVSVTPMNDKYRVRFKTHRKKQIANSKMDTMIKLYESIAEEKSPKELKKRLDARGIFYYDAQKIIGANTFDKRSPEGKALISAKRIVQREKLLAQRGYGINAKRRELNIGMSRLELKDN